MSIYRERRAQSVNHVSRRPRKIIGQAVFLAGLLSLAALTATAQNGAVTLGWNPSTNASAVGYNLYYGEASGVYTSIMDAGTNLTATVFGITLGVNYYFATTAYDTYGQESAFSGEVVFRIPLSPSIVRQPLPQTTVAGAPVTLSVSAIGDAPLSFQWFNGLVPMAGATAASMNWQQIGSNSTGSYSVRVFNSAGEAVSSAATLMVITPPSIQIQPQSQTVIATTAAGLWATVSGTAPLSIQWYCESMALPGATNGALAWTSVLSSNAGQYHLTAGNAAGTVTSSLATLKVLPTNTIATAAGSYNGLFFLTNADGTPAITEATAGFLGNCVVASNGAYSARIYLAGASCPLAGVFSIAGSTSATISLPGTGLSNLTAVMQLDLFNGSQQMTGSISSRATGNAWTAPLLCQLAANHWPQPTGVNLLISPGSSANSPTNGGAATGFVLNGVLSLAGTLGGTTAFSQTVPISTFGNVPLYINLATNGGLLEGWINLTGTAPVGNLTWICPGGGLAPAGFPQGFDTVVQVGGEIGNF